MPSNITILLKKNLLLEKRSWKWTLFEVMTIMVFYTVIVVNPAVKSKNYILELEDAKQTHFYGTRTSLYNLSAFLRLQGLQANWLRYGLIYAPETATTTRIVLATQKALQLHNSVGVIDERSLINHFNPNIHLAGIVFHNVDSSEDKSAAPEKLSITLSFPSEFRTSDHSMTMHRLWLTRCTGVLDDFDSDLLRHVDLYLREGFLQLQHRLFMEWIRILHHPPDNDNDISEKDELDETIGGIVPLITIQSFKHHTIHEPCYTESSSNIIWFLYNFTFFVPFLGLIQKFAREHEENIPAHHWIYGYEQGHHRISHFLISFLHFLLLLSIIYVFVMIEWSTIEKYHIFRHVKPWVFLLFLTLYIIMLIIYAMIVATVFVNTTNSMLFGVAMWLGSYGLFSIVLDSAGEVSIPVLISMLIFFNNFFPLGMKIMKVLESEPDYKQIWILIYTQVANIFILLFILSVADFIRPGRYIRRLYFNFLFVPYLCKRLQNTKVERIATAETVDRPSWYNIEYGPISTGQELLYIKNVITYLDHNRVKQQLKKVSIRFFKSEISVILGAHSSGKTRLITMLAGWRKPHVGYVFYDGQYEIFENWSNYRDTVDVSMPNNPLYDLLTVRETLYYICEVKMDIIEEELVSSEVEKWLSILQPFVPEVDHTVVKYLTFTQKRLLALCCTLACNRKIILLDEPTLHMTVGEQRYYWDILRREKHNRAIIMTTISIDEADAVADRVGILNEGKIVASGTPFFLKTRFGIGFDLIILKDTQASSAPITDLINTFIPNIVPENQIGDQMMYKLPLEQRHLYQRMLIHLEKQSKELGISQIRMRGSNLNEIYMTLGLQESTDIAQVTDATQSLKFSKESPKMLRRQQIQAMLYKKMIYQAPNIIPIIMILAVFLLILLINELTKSLYCPSSINNGIQLGVQMNRSSRAFLDSFRECSYVEITETESAKYQTKLNNKPLYFLFKQFDCGQRPYKEDVLHKTGIYDKLGAVEILENGKHMILWVNERIFHTAALSLNLAHNMILRNLYPDKPQILTTIVNKPMIIPLHVKINLIDNQISHLRLPLTMGIIMPITMSCFVVSLVEERYSHLMTLQRIAGISMDVFWTVGVLWDFGTFFAFSVIYFLVMLAATIEGFGVVAKLLTLVLMNVHGMSALCGIYLMSLFMPDSKYRGFLISIIIQFVFGLCAYVFYWDVVENNRLYFYILSLFPTFALLDGIGNLYTETKEQDYCRERCDMITGCNSENMCALIPICCSDHFLKWSPPGILPALAFMTLSGILSSVGFFCVNLYRIEKLHSAVPGIKQFGTVCYPSDDKDVVKEKVRIANLSMSECKKYQVLVDQVENRIPRHGKLLNTVSFALDRYKSMGIYGGFDSGKSHLIKQLIGEESVSFGEIYFCEKDCKYQSSESYNCLGYCPQDRGLCHAFTPRQLFTLFFMIQGVPKVVASQKLKEISKSLNLRKYMSKRIAFLPANIKRKLNIGLSLIVYNKVLIMDEPTRGMPATDRRQIWNLLRNERFCGNSVIFSSCDSLECETLSDNIIVIDNGEMLAFGSPEYLRVKYTKGIYLEVKLLVDGNTREETEENLESDIENMLTYCKFLHEDSTLVNRYESTLQFYIPVENIRYSYIFGSLEKNQRRLNISEYTIDLPTQLQVLDNILATRTLRDQYKKKSKYKIQSEVTTLAGGPDTQNSQNQDPTDVGYMVPFNEADSFSCAETKSVNHQEEEGTEMKNIPEGSIVIADAGQMYESELQIEEAQVNSDPSRQDSGYEMQLDNRNEENFEESPTASIELYPEIPRQDPKSDDKI